jgi:GntR family transcriptional regulator
MPVTVETAHIPYRLFPGVLNENLEVPHLWILLEKAGIRVGRAIQRVEAREASMSVARLMNIREGAPVLFQESTLYADDGTPVQFSYCYSRGDLYSLTVGLERGRHAGQ